MTGSIFFELDSRPLEDTQPLRTGGGGDFRTDSNGDLQIDPGSDAILKSGGSGGSSGSESWGFVSSYATEQYDSAAASSELWDLDARTSGAYEQWAAVADTLPFMQNL